VYRLFIRPLLFLLPAEKAHQITFKFLRLLFRIPGVPGIFRELFEIKEPKLAKTLFGIRFKNPIGLAAGFDKDAVNIPAFACMGFGFIEIGTVTPQPQSGNAKPRLFRLVDDHAIINRMGFNNSGVEDIVNRLKKRKARIIIGGNIGKNKKTSNLKAHIDYLKCFEALYNYVDYFAINVSSPNTPELRALQQKEAMRNLLRPLTEKNRNLHVPKPLLIKIAPDLTFSEIDDILEIIAELKIDGVIATNTTVSRERLNLSAEKLKQIGPGGLTGLPLRDHSTRIIKYIHEKTGGKLAIIGVGGIMKPEDAIEKLEAGASLVQVYTGLVYNGPGLVKRINKAIANN